jgi:hypothetical protein
LIHPHVVNEFRNAAREIIQGLAVHKIADRSIGIGRNPRRPMAGAYGEAGHGNKFFAHAGWEAIDECAEMAYW